MMTEPIKPAVGDLDALRDALEREANEQIMETLQTTDLGPELALQDIVRAAHHGPRTLTTARALLASPRARRGLTRYWADECPRPEVIDATVASTTATHQEKALAQVTYDLVTTLHANTCTKCRERIDVLTREMRRLEDPDVEIRLWGPYAAPSPELSSVRGDAPRGTVDSAVPTERSYSLHDRSLYRRLPAVRMSEPQDLTVRVQFDPTSQHVHVWLTVPGGMAPDVGRVAVALFTTRGKVQIPIDLAPRDDDDVEFTGTGTLPEGAVPLLDQNPEVG